MSSLDNMRRRLKGDGRKESAINNKLWSLQRTIELGDYNSTEFSIDGIEGGGKCIVNANKLATGYDEKEISAPFDTGIATGQIIYCNDLDSYWIVYRRLVVEKAYFRGLMRQCRPSTIVDNNGNEVRAAIIGPELTRIQSLTDHKMVIDYPNMIIYVWVQNTESNAAFFKRYNKFVYKGRTWQVQSYNDIDFEDILIVEAEENYEQIIEKPEIDNEDVKVDDVYIIGEKVISPLQIQTYKISDKNFQGEWTFSENPNLEILNINEGEITIKWTSPKSGTFTLSFGAIVQEIKVKSLF